MKPTNEQRAAIDCPSIRILLNAAAGSGKTQTLVWRILADVERGTRPDSMVAITFTNAAAKELQQRLAHYGVRLGFAGTLHSYALGWIRKEYRVLGMERPPKIIDEETARARTEAAAKKLSVKSVSFKAVQSLLGVNGGTAAHIVAKEYMAECRRTCTVDYETMLAMFELLARSAHYESPMCLYVDEYQDSGDRDARIYQAMKPGLDFRVGDPRQSIYSFRGGNVKHIVEYAKTAEVFPLTMNRRSGPAIVGLANDLLHSAITVRGKTYAPMAFPGIECPNMVAFHDEERAAYPLNVCNWRTALDEAQSIAAMCGRGGQYEGQEREVAVLTRYNSRASFIRDILRASGVPIAETKVLEAPRLAISALRALSAWKSGKITPATESDAVEWLESLRLEGLRLKAGQAKMDATTYAMLHCNVQAALPLGANLVNMGLEMEDIRLIGEVWTGDENTTADALEIESEREVSEGVHVGTFHSFKGRERNVVFLAGLESESVPGTKTGDAFYEELRLMYVGITRARWELRMSWCDEGMDSMARPVPASSKSPFIVA